MFDIDKWQEIAATIRANKLRTALTALGVFWGIFMLIGMLGAGNGLETGVNRSMSGMATNAMFVFGRRTTLPYAGLTPGRAIRFDNSDIAALREVSGIEHLAPGNRLGGWRGSNLVVRGNRTGGFSVSGEYPEYLAIQPLDIGQGRFINDIDMADSRKVAVIGEAVREVLFGPGEEVIGESIRVGGVYFQVVGVFKSLRQGEDAETQEQSVFVPFSTFQRAFGFSDRVDVFAVGARPDVDVAALEREIRLFLGARHRVHPDDIEAVGAWNVKERFDRTQRLFIGIRFLTWFVGVFTLLAGVVGVSNIMLIVVKERTKEIGVRKALGATPLSIVSTVVQEAIVLTSVAGYAGLVAGIGLLELIRWLGLEGGSFANPTVDVGTAITATIILIAAGGLAGVVPAWQAARIEPVEALRAE